MADPMNHPAGPAPTSGGPGLGRYLLGSDDEALLGQVTDVLVTSGHGRVVRRPSPGLVVVELPEAVADDVQRLFANRLVVERDLELDPLPPVGPVPGPGEPSLGRGFRGEPALDRGDHHE
jgi:hypothetical protein